MKMLYCDFNEALYSSLDESLNWRFQWNTVQWLYGDPSVQFVVIPLKVFNDTNEILYCDFNEALYSSLDESLNWRFQWNTVQWLYGDPSVQFVVIPLKVFNDTNEILYCDFNEALYSSLDESLNWRFQWNTVQWLYGDPSVQFVVIPLKVFNDSNEILYCDFNEALYSFLDESLNWRFQWNSVQWYFSNTIVYDSLESSLQKVLEASIQDDSNSPMLW